MQRTRTWTSLTGLCVLMTGLIGCGADSGSQSDTAASSTGAQTDGGATSPDPTSGGAESPGDDAPTLDSTGFDPDAICGIDAADSVSFNVRHNGVDLPESEAVLQAECGGQGSFMFYFPVDIFGVQTAETSVPFSVTLDIDGFNDAATGHFIDNNPEAYVGCDDFQGGSNSLSVVLPDGLSDPAALDGAAFSLEISMLVGDAPSFTTSGTVSAVEGGGWDWCYGCDEFEGCPEDTTGGSSGSDSGTGDSGTGDSGTAGTDSGTTGG